MGFAAIAVAAFALVAASVVVTKALDLAPCSLCIFQRMLYLLLALLALVALASRRLRLWFGVTALLTSLGGLATATYQSWLQVYPPDSFACGPGNPGPIETLVNWAGTQIPWLFSAWGECSSTEWEFFGLSIANGSALAFLGFSLLLALLVKKVAAPGG